MKRSSPGMIVASSTATTTHVELRARADAKGVRRGRRFDHEDRRKPLRTGAVDGRAGPRRRGGPRDVTVTCRVEQDKNVVTIEVGSDAQGDVEPPRKGGTP
jgi:hypothetical protein